jgi:hypothetical protein
LVSAFFAFALMLAGMAHLAKSVRVVAKSIAFLCLSILSHTPPQFSEPDPTTGHNPAMCATQAQATKTPNPSLSLLS